MSAFVDDILPASLAARLKDEQRQAVAEAPRAQRLLALGAALGLNDAAALETLAVAAGLDVASNLETDPGARGLLPARLVHDYQIIPIKFGPEPKDRDGEAALPTQPLHLAASWPPDAARSSASKSHPSLHSPPPTRANGPHCAFAPTMAATVGGWAARFGTGTRARATSQA